jgi:hypothetical protein
MLLRNNARRLITVNGSMGADGYTEFYDIKPGENPPVEIPDHLAKSDFVKNLINIGELIVLQSEAAPVDTEALEALRDEAMLLGINVDKSWDAARIQTEIDKEHE